MSESAVGFQALARWQRVAADPRSAAGAFGFGAVALVGFSNGGYYESTWRWAGLAFGAVVAIQLLLRRYAAPSRLALVSLGALGSLGAWMLVSPLWGVDGTEALREAKRCAVYVVGLGALLAVVRSSTSRWLLAGVLAGIATLGVFALGDRLLFAPTLDPYQGSLLKDPVGYANALGVLMALGVVLSIGFMCETRDRLRRSALLAAAAVCAVDLVLTSSRGAWLAMLVGLGILGVLRLGRNGSRRRLVAGSTVVLAAVVIVAAPVSSRVSLGDRPAYWGVAIEDASDHVVLGSGAGTFDDYWREHRPIAAYVRDAHSLYLETAAELGIVGLALLLCALGAPLVAGAMSRGRPLVSIAAAAYVTFLVHAGLDWDWEMPVTTLAGLALAAALLVSPRADV